MEPITRKDPLTGQIFFPKKISQKYACPENRIKHNNKKASILRQERAILDKHFHKNHVILRKIFIEGGDNVFNSFWMLGKGFRFIAANHQKEYEGVLRYCVYEYMLVVVEETDNIKIIKIW
jgi:hypothetical protein